MPRLDALVARNLGIGRTKARALVAQGALRDAQDAPFPDPRAEVTGPLRVTWQGRVVEFVEEAHVLLHKPAGCVTALSDARHPTAYTLLRDAPLFAELRPVGRLDLDTTGLLLWTSDGQLLHRLTHPKGRVVRTYQAALAGPFLPPPPDFALDDGHRPEIVRLAEMPRADLHPALLVPEGAERFAEIALIGGAYHEVRRIFAALGSHVLALARVAFGPYVLPRDLAPGGFVLLPPESG